MSKPFLVKEDSILESHIIETMLAGLHEWRPDLHYPESHSDMQGCVRALLRMFKVERRPLNTDLRILCYDCEGIGKTIRLEGGTSYQITCQKCKGRGYTT